MSKEYVCADCGGTFNEGWSDEEANAEALEQWGVESASERADMARICDDCYKRIVEEHPLGLRNLK